MRKNFMVILAASMVMAMSGCASSSSTQETTTAETTTTVADTTAATTEAETTVTETTEEITTVEDTTEEDAPVASDENPDVDDSDIDNPGDSDEVECNAEKIGEVFKAEVANTTDIQALAEKLSAYEVCGFDCGTLEVEEGFLNGFSAEISGFTKGIQFGPWIGSVPFIGYVFETEDAEALKEALDTNADPRWNICTEAKEKLILSEGNIVFFTMCPGPQDF